MEDIKKIENDLWEAADQLRANSKLTASEYSMPVLGIIFLRYAYNRFLIVKEEIEENLPSRNGKKRPVTKEDFESKSAIFLPEIARYDNLAALEEDKDIGRSINDAMKAIEEEYEKLKGSLPTNYTIFDNELLRELIRKFNSNELRNAKGDVFGRIYEYFLNKFAMTGAQEGGEFFTPISLVQMIVNVIEPEQGTVLDPACGSAGMFVQTGHFIESHGANANDKVTFYGQEKAELNTKLARMNMAVHGLEGKIFEGNTFYEDKHELLGKCDYVMANPPFNVDGVDSEKIKADPRLPFGLPGVNKKSKAVSNANYLWIQYFYSYLNEKGRAGFVMASSATDAGHGEKDVRERLVKTKDVDVIISIGNNFFYTRSLQCTLWFFDKNKSEDKKDKVLMIDARNIFRKVNRTINDFSEEQLKNLTSIVWLYRGQNERYLKLIDEYIKSYSNRANNINEVGRIFEDKLQEIVDQLERFNSFKLVSDENEQIREEYYNSLKELQKDIDNYFIDKEVLNKEIEAYKNWCKENIIDDFNQLDKANTIQVEQYNKFEEISKKIKSKIKVIDHLYKEANNLIDKAEKELDAKKSDSWDTKKVREDKKKIDEAKKDFVEFLKEINYLYGQVKWLQSKFNNAKFENIEGLCKLVDIEEIEKNDWSLTPGRYVGVAQNVDEDFDFEGRLKEILIELDGLNEEAFELAKVIKCNFEELGL
ncbi:N-6 DNA methylase [Clostridium beijerinckii]|uniref:N-6 DNA methylase n=1 Tax=Clostridium beijerinckii TaxID=1520 RepID=UPI00098CC037|nr:N-6 DNA methylase [Clostridium beijerinckii]NRU38922.1 type I restriction enzyme M protein [Clostridium beijerinckii]NSA97799.1 type I restriction enzyme M protein [Clostridium beijerinckii]OOM68665.1 putative type I restriction enzymeP M protein [Clostridium beijerinckii]OOM72626.1 putative type I restriction enzymeP M protein [Clostridium beijerinckii]CUU48429.1 Type I restriction-modification system DNA methylase [Clostridium beijerinckii]